jgi:hypothetical protein
MAIWRHTRDHFYSIGRLPRRAQLPVLLAARGRAHQRSAPQLGANQGRVACWRISAMIAA